MNKLFSKVTELHARNATHRSGFRLNELSRLEILQHAKQELAELEQSIRLGESDSAQRKELGDTLGCLYGVMLLSGWLPDEVERDAILKLTQRFTIID